MSPYKKIIKNRSKLKEYIQTINKTSKNINYEKKYDKKYEKYDKKEKDQNEYINKDKQNEKHITEYIKAFTKVYENHIWGTNNVPDYEGSSGVGSDIRYNSKTYVPFLKHLYISYV